MGIHAQQAGAAHHESEQRDHGKRQQIDDPSLGVGSISMLPSR